jgi:hypothetical protein
MLNNLWSNFIVWYVGVVQAADSVPVTDKIETELKSEAGYFTKLIPLLNKGGTTRTLGTIIDDVISLILWLVGILAVVFILWGGISYITSAGDDAKATKARQTIINAVIGIVLVLLAFVIQAAVARIFGNTPATTP